MLVAIVVAAVLVVTAPVVAVAHAHAAAVVVVVTPTTETSTPSAAHAESLRIEFPLRPPIGPLAAPLAPLDRLAAYIIKERLGLVVKQFGGAVIFVLIRVGVSTTRFVARISSSIIRCGNCYGGLFCGDSGRRGG